MLIIVDFFIDCIACSIKLLIELASYSYNTLQLASEQNCSATLWLALYNSYLARLAIAI